MTHVLSVIPIAAPLLLLALGALVSEYAGRMALFLDGMINLSAFLCYALTAVTGNAAASCVLSVALCTLVTAALERIASRMGANMFLASLAMNLLFSAAASFLSALLFKTRGVLYGDFFLFDAATARSVTTIVCLSISALLILILALSKQGLRMRITGSNPDVLEASGIPPDAYRCASWLCAAFCGAAAGCTYAVRLSSFVPGMASGRGWTALAAVFLGRKDPRLVVPAVIVFAAAEYAGSRVQNIPQFADVPPSLLLALPYLLALVLIAAVPRRNGR